MTDKKLFSLSVAVGVAVLAVVVTLNIIPEPGNVPGFVKYLPMLNAFLNGTCSLLLLASLYFIKRKNIPVHKKLNLTAFFLSSLFLVSYIVFHYCTEETKFPADNPVRPLYLFILLTHIVLAAVILPFILVTFYFGLNMQVEKHRKIVRWSYPVWLYVTVTGVVVYLMISPYYSF